MASYYYIAHSGVLNMKWGQRRYQYKDGSLTPLGRIHYGIKNRRDAKVYAKRVAESKKREAESKKRAAELEAKRVATERQAIKLQNDSNANRDPRTMTDAELQSLVNRLRNEQTYLQLTGQTQQNTAASAGESWYVKFGKDLVSQTLSSVAKQAGSAIAKGIVNQVLGTSTDDNSKKKTVSSSKTTSKKQNNGPRLADRNPDKSSSIMLIGDGSEYERRGNYGYGL